MRVRILKVIRDITIKHYEKLLDNGAFPEIQWERVGTGKGHSYSLFPYSDTHARYMKLLDVIVKDRFGYINGIFTRKHSKGFLDKLTVICAEITEEDIKNQGERFHSFADDVIAEAMKPSPI